MKQVMAAVLCICTALSCPGVLAEGRESCEVLDVEKVYYGDCNSFQSPATVAMDEVFEHIHEYRLIGERKLGEEDPEYWVLLSKANKVFRAAIKTVAATGGYDLVAERGALKALAPATTIPDITALVIAQVERDSEGS